MAAYKVGAEGGHADCQWMVGSMYYYGHGVAVDFKLARPWVQKAAAQDEPVAVGHLGGMYMVGEGVTPSFRRARELNHRAIELGDSISVENKQNLTTNIQKVS